MLVTKLSVIIPAFNEGKTILAVLTKIREVNLKNDIDKEVILVDDCSTDDTEKLVQNYIADNPQVTIYYLKHTINQGKGAAIHTGIAKATGECLIIQDADMEYDPEEYNELLKPVLKGYADVVYGSRFMGGSPHRILFFWHSVGNKFLTFLSNMVTNLNLTDMETGFKLFNTRLIQSLPLEEKRFGFEPEVTVKMAKVPNIRIYEIGISYYGRTYKDGKKVSWRDGLQAIYCIIKYGLLK